MVLKYVEVGICHRWCIRDAYVGRYIDRKNMYGVNKLKPKTCLILMFC